ncbi:MAG: hypothetical protein Roseis3KO_33510 [Roseivirga sp.]
MAKEDLIRAFLKGECSEKELQELRFWLSLPENKEEAESLFKMKWEEISGDELITDYDKESVFDGIQAKVRELEKPAPITHTTKDRVAYGYPRKKRGARGIKVVVGLAMILLIGYFVIPSPETNSDSSIEQITRVAPRGYRNTITLMDGSTATLNSESSITYAKDFGKEDRIIYLTGEAFFRVARDETKPFVVISKDLKTTALGTSFNVNAYEGNDEAISLATGKVKVELKTVQNSDTPREEMILTPGEQAVWAGESSGLTKRDFDFREILSWKNNVIYFNNTELKSMIRVLEKWYDVQITIEGNTNRLTDHGTGKFKNESLENVLSSLGFTMGFTYQINEKKITLKLTEKKND